MIKTLITKETWIKTRYAENEYGEELPPQHPDAVKFDLVGAMLREYPDPQEQLKVLRKLRSNLKVTQKFVGRLKDFNDSCTWEMMEQVLRWCDV